MGQLQNTPVQLYNHCLRSSNYTYFLQVDLESSEGSFHSMLWSPIQRPLDLFNPAIAHYSTTLHLSVSHTSVLWPGISLFSFHVD